MDPMGNNQSFLHAKTPFLEFRNIFSYTGTIDDDSAEPRYRARICSQDSLRLGTVYLPTNGRNGCFFASKNNKDALARHFPSLPGPFNQIIIHPERTTLRAKCDFRPIKEQLLSGKKQRYGVWIRLVFPVRNKIKNDWIKVVCHFDS